MSSVKEMALELAAKRKAKEEADRKAAELRFDALGKQRRDLEQAIKETLAELNPIIDVSSKASFYVELTTGTFRYADDCDEVPYTNWVIRWRDSQGHVHGGHSCVETFKRGFAQFISQYL